MPANYFRLVFLTLLAPMLLCAGTILHQSPLTVLMDFEAPHSDASLQALRLSLNQLLSPTGLLIDIQLKDDLPTNPQFGQLVMFKMKGSCSLNPMPLAIPPDERGPLGMAYTSDGAVLHFGEVECDRVRHCIQRILGFNASLKNQQTYGSALAVVIAHEVYHMLGNATKHTRDGITKAQLSPSELIDSELKIPAIALSKLQKIRVAVHSENNE